MKETILTTSFISAVSFFCTSHWFHVTGVKWNYLRGNGSTWLSVSEEGGDWLPVRSNKASSKFIFGSTCVFIIPNYVIRLCLISIQQMKSYVFFFFPVSCSVCVAMWFSKCRNGQCAFESAASWQITVAPYHSNTPPSPAQHIVLFNQPLFASPTLPSNPHCTPLILLLPDRDLWVLMSVSEEF